MRHMVRLESIQYTSHGMQLPPGLRSTNHSPLHKVTQHLGCIIFNENIPRYFDATPVTDGSDS